MMNWKETKCGKCKIQRARPVCNSCFSYDKFIPIAITNADRIRSMSDEELAELLIKTDCCIANAGEVDCSQSDECGICGEVIRNWLQSEAEE